MKSRLAAIGIALAIAATLAAQNSAPSAAPQRAITEKDLFDFVWVANPQLSPDGSRVAFTHVVSSPNLRAFARSPEDVTWVTAISLPKPHYDPGHSFPRLCFHI